MKALIKTVAVASLALCAVFMTLHYTERFWMKDYAGLTKAQVEKMELAEQYVMLGERMKVMSEYLEPAQRAIRDGEWEVGDVGEITPAHDAVLGLPGATWTNSYYLRTRRSWVPEGGGAERSDLDAFEQYVEAHGWEYEIQKWEFTSDHQWMLRADTGEGWMLFFTARSQGNHTLEVLSGTYWGDREGLMMARHAREYDRGPLYALPGMLPEFPSWDAPLKQNE